MSNIDDFTRDKNTIEAGWYSFVAKAYKSDKSIQTCYSHSYYVVNSISLKDAKKKYIEYLESLDYINIKILKVSKDKEVKYYGML